MDLMSKSDPKGLVATTLVVLLRQKTHWSQAVSFAVQGGPFAAHVVL